jgi:hypothetical protein
VTEPVKCTLTLPDATRHTPDDILPASDPTFTHKLDAHMLERLAAAVLEDGVSWQALNNPNVLVSDQGDGSDGNSCNIHCQVRNLI